MTAAASALISAPVAAAGALAANVPVSAATDVNPAPADSSSTWVLKLVTTMKTLAQSVPNGSEFSTVVALLKKITGNIKTYPTVSKYRKLDLESKALQTLRVYPQSFDVLKIIGFRNSQTEKPQMVLTEEQLSMEYINAGLQQFDLPFEFFKGVPPSTASASSVLTAKFATETAPTPAARASAYSKATDATLAISNMAAPVDTQVQPSPVSRGIESDTFLHLAALAGDAERVRALLMDLHDPTDTNIYGDTALHYAVRQRHVEVVRLLLPVSNWAAVCKEHPPVPFQGCSSCTFFPDRGVEKFGSRFAPGQKVGTWEKCRDCKAVPEPFTPSFVTPIEEALLEYNAAYDSVTERTDGTATLVEGAIRQLYAQGAQSSVEPERAWAIKRLRERVRKEYTAMDALMALRGLKKVKNKALELFDSVRMDMARPEESRVSTSQGLNFIFTGNSGTGKTTVAKIFADLLKQLKLRQNKKEVTDAPALLMAGGSKFGETLKKANPGTLVIDEVYAAALKHVCLVVYSLTMYARVLTPGQI